MLEVKRVAIYEADLRVRIEQISGAPQRTRGQPVVCGYQDGVVTVGPPEQTLVVGGDVPLVGGMGDYLDARIPSRDLPCHVHAAVRRRIVDDQDPHIDVLLVVERTLDGLIEVVAVVVARDDHVYPGHGMPACSRGCDTATVQ